MCGWRRSSKFNMRFSLLGNRYAIMHRCTRVQNPWGMFFPKLWGGGHFKRDNSMFINKQVIKILNWVMSCFIPTLSPLCTSTCMRSKSNNAEDLMDGIEARIGPVFRRQEFAVAFCVFDQKLNNNKSLVFQYQTVHRWFLKCYFKTENKLLNNKLKFDILLM